MSDHDCTALDAFLAFLGLVAKSAPSRRFSLLSRRRPSKPRNSRERPALDDRVRYLGLLAAYLPCGRVSPSSSQGSPPSDKSVATCTYMPHRWMDAASHQTRQWSARADIRSYLRSASSREHARILGFDGLQHAGRRKTNKQQARRRLESRAWWTLFLEARRRSRGRTKRARQG